jgi:hypothetical protein
MSITISFMTYELIHGRAAQTSAQLQDQRGFPRHGTYSMIGTPAGLVRGRGPTIRIKKGDKVVFKASHGIGHLMNSIHQVRVPHKVRTEPSV